MISSFIVLFCVISQVKRKLELIALLAYMPLYKVAHFFPSSGSVFIFTLFALNELICLVFFWFIVH